MLPNPRRTREALQYIHSLQLLVLIIHPAALSAAPNFTPDELDKLDKNLADPDLNCFIEIIETLLTHIELEPLRMYNDSMRPPPNNHILTPNTCLCQVNIHLK